MFDEFKNFLKSEVCEKIVHIKAAHIWQRFYSFSAHKSDVIALMLFPGKFSLYSENDHCFMTTQPLSPP